MEGSLRVAGTIAESIVDGPGIRYVIFTQGCPHRCAGCQNPQTHDFDGGTVLKLDTLYADIMRNPMIGGVTFSGGEPFSQARPLAVLAEALHAKNKHIMTYSGYTFEQILQLGEDENALLAQCDLLVDGPFIETQRDLTLRFRGSRNQRILDVPASLKTGAPVWAKGYQQVP
ncbi:anaerobic ribonucleoside-triphosphate reductase activating protein [Intestinibacillus massiliensis]|nr:anaerobic ribonucleoside-triphosphate reductase activating protein [Intestinibacillus massiliensis]